MLHAVGHSVAQRKCHGRYRLASACRHRQRINTFGFFAASQTFGKYFPTILVHFIFRIRPFLYVFFQLSEQSFHTVITAARQLIRLHEAFRIQIVRVYKAGIKHPRPRGGGKATSRGSRCRRGLGQFAGPVAPVRLNTTSQPPFYSSVKCGVAGLIRPFVAHIRQSAVMAYHAHGGLPEAGIRALNRAGRRMVDLRPAV